MAEHGSQVHESQFEKMKEHMKHGVDRMFHHKPRGQHYSDEAEKKPQNGNAAEPESRYEPSSNFGFGSNYDDFPFDSNRPDPFTAELASVADDDDGVISPKSQSSILSFDTMYSSASGQSWTSNQRTIGGYGIRESRSQEQLGPYKYATNEESERGDPADYQEYMHKTYSPSHDNTHSRDTARLMRSNSTSSEQSVPDSLYADLSSVSNRDMQVSDSVLRPEESDYEEGVSPSQENFIGDHISHLKLQDPKHSNH